MRGHGVPRPAAEIEGQLVFDLLGLSRGPCVGSGGTGCYASGVGNDVESVARERTASLRARALELGFDAFGVARAGPPDPEGRLRAWLDAGHHGDMAWLADSHARRTDLEASLPGAKSVVALSVSYYAPAGEKEVDAALKVARYARGDDYHRWLKRRLRKLRKHLLELAPEARVYPTVDTSPVLERAWAARAGIAWIGKSTMAIHPRLGTYTFLATLVTNVDLVPDEPLPDRCGSCTACLEACPTDAFPEPGVLDARRCISYWTLETSEPLPEEAPDFHGWVAGCDVCQEVCPWNKFARPTQEHRAEPREALRVVDPSVFLGEDEPLAEVLRGSALQRNGPEGMRRNARHALLGASSRRAQR